MTTGKWPIKIGSQLVSTISTMKKTISKPLDWIAKNIRGLSKKGDLKTLWKTSVTCPNQDYSIIPLLGKPIR
jgi:hypothetical protein